MRGWRFAVVFACGLVVSACAATTPTSKVAVDYNRIFAKARNEVLITNILRASAEEPLQFSTMGSVTGGVRNTGLVNLTIPSLIGRGATILSPEFTVNEGINPNVSIVPLSNKEFTEGIMKPVTLDEMNYFINQGWDQELVLELAIGGIVCPNGDVVFSRGRPSSEANYDGFARMFANTDRFPIQMVSKSNPKIVRMSASDALAIMKNGVGAGRTVEVKPVIDNGRPTQLADVTIDSEPTEQLTGLRTDSVCPSGSKQTGRKNVRPDQKLVEIAKLDGKEQGKVILRSVEAIIYFLGETQYWRWHDHGCGPAADPWPYYYRKRVVNGALHIEQLSLMRLNKVCPGRPAPVRIFAQTHFNDDTYYMLRQADEADFDRSLSTLSLLNELIALQTSESTIAAGAPIIAIGSR